MILDVHNRLGPPQKVTATRALVRADNGTIMALVMELADGLIEVRTAKDSNFAALLKLFGISDIPEVIRPSSHA